MSIIELKECGVRRGKRKDNKKVMERKRQKDQDQEKGMCKRRTLRFN